MTYRNCSQNEFSGEYVGWQDVGEDRMSGRCLKLSITIFIFINLGAYLGSMHRDHSRLCYKGEGQGETHTHTHTICISRGQTMLAACRENTLNPYSISSLQAITLRNRMDLKHTLFRLEFSPHVFYLGGGSTASIIQGLLLTALWGYSLPCLGDHME